MNANSDMVMLLIAMPLSMLITFLSWRSSLVFLFYWVVLVGALRKWGLPQISDILFFSPYLVLTGVYVQWTMGRFRNAGIDARTLLTLSITAVWCFISAFNPHLPDYRIGILGLIMHFAFVPLLFAVPMLFKDKDELIRFLRTYVLLSIAVLILGTVQFFSPVDSAINQYTDMSMHIAKVGRFPRVTSTFSYISGFATYLNVLFMILIYLMVSRVQTRLMQVALPALLLFTMANLFMTGSRGPVAVTILSSMVFFVFVNRYGSSILGKIVVRGLISAAMLFLLLQFTDIAQEAFRPFKERTQELSDVQGRLMDTFTPFKFLSSAGLSGFGIGSTYQGAAALTSDWGEMPRDFEEESERIVLELGLIGFLLMYLLRLHIMIKSFQIAKMIRDIDLKLLTICSAIFQAQFICFNNLAFNQTASFFYWFFVGVVFTCRRLDQVPTS